MARIAPLDHIKFIASPLPTSLGVNGTFTNLSPALTLSAAVTKTIDNCESGWIGEANVTVTHPTTRKQGSFSTQLAIAAGFTTGLVAHKPLGATQDFSAYQQISMWMRANAASITAGVFEIKLCSDTAGATPVDTLAVPLCVGTDAWNAIVMDKAAALGASIQSIAIYAASDPGTVTLIVDNIIAAKAVASADSLTHRSLIAKSSGAEAGRWYPIESIDGVNVVFGMGVTSSPAANRGIYITSETVAVRKREAYLTPPIASGQAADVLDAGTSDLARITFSGGWDLTDMSTQLSGEDGYTWFTGQNGLGNGVRSSQAFVTLSRFGFAFYDAAIFADTGGNQIYDKVNASGCGNGAFTMTAPNGTATDCKVLNSSVRGLTNNSQRSITLKNSLFHNAQQFDPVSVSGAVEMVGCEMRNGTNQGFVATNASVKMRNCVIGQNGTRGITNINSEILAHNCLFEDTTEVGFVTITPSRMSVISRNHDRASGVHKRFFSYGQVTMVADADRRTPTGTAWKFEPQSVDSDSNAPVEEEVLRIRCFSGVPVTASIWLKRNNSAISAQLICKGGQIAGVDNDVTDTLSGEVIGEYQQQTINFTPTADGEVVIHVQAWGGTSHAVWADDEAQSGSVAPAVGDVRSGTAYAVDGALYTGTAVIPSLANTKIGVAGDGGTGTYDGSDRWSDPGVTHVRSGTAYKANSTSNNRTGTAAIPGASDVKVGVATDATVGTYDGSDRWSDPGVANVRLATAYKANSLTNNRTGTVREPATSEVKVGVAYGAADALTGTYDGSDRWTDPLEANVKIGTAYKANSTSNNKTGIYTGADRWSDPGVANVKAGVAYEANDVAKVGTLEVVTNIVGEMELEAGSLGTKRRITQGDALPLLFRAKHAANYHDLTGATLETRIPKNNSQDLVIPNGQHTIDPDQVTNRGKFTVTVTAEQSAQLMASGSLSVVTKITQGGQIIHNHGQGVLEVLDANAYTP